MAMSMMPAVALSDAAVALSLSSSGGGGGHGPDLDFHGGWKAAAWGVGIAGAAVSGYYADKFVKSFVQPILGGKPDGTDRAAGVGMSVLGACMGGLIACLGGEVGGRTGGVILALGAGAAAGCLGGGTLAALTAKGTPSQYWG
jgi:hypothetical protein